MKLVTFESNIAPMTLSSLSSAAIAPVVSDSIKGTKQERLIREKHPQTKHCLGGDRGKNTKCFHDRYPATQESF